MYIVDVLVEHPIYSLDHTFSYLSDDSIQKGIRVKVPFGKQNIIGYVEKVSETFQSIEELEKENGFKMKYISEVLDEKPLLNYELEKVADFLANTTLSPKIACLLTMLPPHLKVKENKEVAKKYQKYVQAISISPLTTSKQKECYEYIAKFNQPIEIEKIPFTKNMIKKLYELHAIDVIQVEVFSEYKEINQRNNVWPSLNQQQSTALKQLLSAKESGKTALLYGVTGSGKTEVYLNLVKQVLEEGQTAIMLVPEISLTPMMVSVFKERFGKRVAVLHSRLSVKEKYDEYSRILSGEVSIVVGARSAIFAPLDHIGVIILDEEHDSSYKQESNVRYHAKDVALFRANYHKAFVILGSASPSVESYARAKKGSYALISMPDRFNEHELPKVEIIDMIKEMHSNNYSMISRRMEERITSTIQQGNQVILLMNRRGYANYLMCGDCGYIPKCPHCDVSLTYHSNDHQLKCHYCGYEIKMIHNCPNCNSNQIKTVGQGIQQVEEYLMNRIQGAKVIRMDVDTTRRKDGHEKILEAFGKHEYNILLGTQMVAKGLNFHDVTFVGVVQADLMLNLPDFRASERTFQLLLQVSGRSGRGKKQGEVMIQTYNPDHYAIQMSAHHDYLGFFKQEMKYRYLGNYPPYCHIASIIIRSKNEKKLENESLIITNYLKQQLQHTMILGPAKGLVYKVKDMYRQRIMLKYTSSANLYPVLNELITRYNKASKEIEILIDFNPYNQS